MHRICVEAEQTHGGEKLAEAQNGSSSAQRGHPQCQGASVLEARSLAMLGMAIDSLPPTSSMACSDVSTQVNAVVSVAHEALRHARYRYSGPSPRLAIAVSYVVEQALSWMAALVILENAARKGGTSETERW